MNQRDFRTNESKEKHMHQFQMNFLSRESSRKHVQMQQGFLAESIRKQSSKLLGNKTLSHKDKSKSKSIKPFNLMAQGRQQQQEVSFARFELNFFSYLGETALAYGLLIGICYLIKVANFPYFQILLTLGLLNSISPWNFSNIIMIFAAVIVICNHYLKITVMTYPAILICYLSVMLFNEQNKIKILFILVLILQMSYGFGLLPGLYSVFNTDSKEAFYYLFPLFMFVIRIIVYIFLYMIKYSELIFLQIPLFLTGLQYGVILTLKTSQIQYWYLMVFFTLEIINDRTQFLVRILISVMKSCRDNIGSRQANYQDNDSSDENKEKRDISILAAHASGHACIHSFHIICLIYIFTELPIYSSPYTKSTVLISYTEEQWYIPLATWALATVYEIMCLIHERNRRDRLLIGHTKNTILYTILRAFMLTLGFWIFYLGLGVGNLMVYPENTRTPTV